MSTSLHNSEALAVDVSCTDDALSVTLADGRAIAVPLAWFPRLLRATRKQRADWEFIGGGVGIHWEAVDEDISVASLLQPENFMRLPNERIQPAKSRRTPTRKRRSRARLRG